MNTLLVTQFVSVIIIITLVLITLRYRKRIYQAVGKPDIFPITSRKLSDFHNIFKNNTLGPELSTEIQFIGLGDHVPGGISDTETWILCVLSKISNNIFEFGTATGKTAYLMARHSSPDAKISTLTLADTFKNLNELSESLSLCRFTGTSLVAYCTR